jgi:hypothetical protein
VKLVIQDTESRYKEVEVESDVVPRIGEHVKHYYSKSLVVEVIYDFRDDKCIYITVDMHA